MKFASKPNGDPWYVNDVAEVLAAITHAGAPVDPTGLEAVIVRPDNTTTTAVPTNTGPGADYLRVAFTKPGTWQVVVQSLSGEYRGVAEIAFSVKKAPGV